MPDLQKLALIGGGLIGGSLALALKEKQPDIEIALFDLSPQHRQAAMARGIADQASDDLQAVIQDADMVVIATPVFAIESVLQDLAALSFPERVVITDVGSTKVSIIQAAERALGDRANQFVAGHPIAGAETSGPLAARADLFKGRRVVLTPTGLIKAGFEDRVARLWAITGAEVHRLSPKMHDEVFAAVSHLPHILSYALVDLLARRDSAETLFGYAAGGFRDFTRIAASNPVMWKDITLANRDAILKELTAYMDELNTLKALIENGQGAEIEALFERAQSARLRSAKTLD